ncbi:hydroxycinnamoyltransferase-like [Nymphaea colorata]|nr:hydroxycinnamoyltransferase-like [Nymphaea colorata]
MSPQADQEEGLMSRVQLKAKKTVVSGQPCRQGKVYPLSVIDHMMGLYSLRLIFYYDHPLPVKEQQPRRLAGMSNNHSSGRGGPVVVPLEESLSEALAFFPPVTGRLNRDADGNWEVKCNDAGVRTVEAAVPGATVAEWLEAADPEAELSLAQWEKMPDDPTFWSPFYVQLTEFRDGGFSIGLSCPHMHADPHCAALLVKAWGDVHRKSGIANPPFFHSHGLRLRKSPNTATASVEYYRSKAALPPPPPADPDNSLRFNTITFRFSDVSVRRVVSEISESLPDATPFEVLAGLMWSACARATPAASHLRDLNLLTEFRKAMHAPLPHGFFGNAIHFSHVQAGAEELAGDGGIAVAARAIRADACRTEEDVRSVIDWWEERREPEEGSDAGSGGKFLPPIRMYGPALTCANLEGVMAYGASFVEGRRPSHVSCHVIPPEGEGVVLVMPSPEEGLSRTVIATLPEEVARRVRADPEIAKYEPKILFGGQSK